MFAKVIIDCATNSAIDRLFTYEVPSQLIDRCAVGSRVKVPFGQANKTRIGYVLGICSEVDNSFKIKKVLDVIDLNPIINEEQISMINFLVEHYGASYASSAANILPKVDDRAIETAKQFVNYILPLASLNILEDYIEEIADKKSLIKQYEILSELVAYGELEESNWPNYKSSINTLMRNKLIQREARAVVLHKDRICYEQFIELNKEQTNAYEVISSNYNKARTILLEGVTGSGKTEVFLHIIRDVLEAGKSVIVLVPEIALTKQTLERFVNRFGNRVALTHSKVTQKQRKQIYMQAQSGEIQIVIGPRSAVFTPFSNLGLIVIDEEHDGSYKSERSPKYNAIEVAIMRMRLHCGIVLLASATPSVSSYYKAKMGMIEHVMLTQRAGGASMPQIEFVDMRLENCVISTRLHEAIEQTLKDNKQVMILLNRRGYSTFINCRECGFVVKCTHCDVTMTYHQKDNILICHHCLSRQVVPTICPSCKSKRIRYFGDGTQKVEEYLNNHFGHVGVSRMDIDTTSSKEGFNKILTAFNNRETNILVGTQMISKGHDFSNVTLVGVIAADSSLYISDFRASERTYQLLTQTVGRAGRGDTMGNVIIQTYEPDNSVLLDVKLGRQKSFYETELEFREASGYPPFGYMFTVMICGNNEDIVIKKAHHIMDYFKYYNRKKLFRFIGPTQAPIPKLADEYRWLITILGVDRDLLLLYGRYCIDKFSEHSAQVKINWDIM
ncbi:MAG: primosomal protein N' [Epulopiscium sp. Nuni2H_MBin001]|nr:MAG: primosomal protein N' [Epulopiscium sp. Nuni2H_MBin001]